MNTTRAIKDRDNFMLFCCWSMYVRSLDPIVNGHDQISAVFVGRRSAFRSSNNMHYELSFRSHAYKPFIMPGLIMTLNLYFCTIRGRDFKLLFRDHACQAFLVRCSDFVCAIQHFVMCEVQHSSGLQVPCSRWHSLQRRYEKRCKTRERNARLPKRRKA